MDVSQLSMWVVFNIFVFGMLALDLGVFHRKDRPIKLREALMWSSVWIALALVFNVFVWFSMGSQKASEFLAAYLTEKMLSVDNLFVFLLIFSYFNVPLRYQHKILFWGILTAIIARGIFILSGEVLIQAFHWSVYALGILLIALGGKILLENEEKQIHPEKNMVIRFFKKFTLISDNADGKFFVKQSAHFMATPLFITLLAIESTDLIFALDSIPAVIAITYDPFIAYTSNIFAILGLRALYFTLAGIKDIFQDLRFGIAAILVFIGIKMELSDIYKIPTGIILCTIVGTLTIFAMISILRRRKNESYNRI
jgi:tellurite resistance protein TerC